MLFNSGQFLIFLPIVVLCYYIIPQKLAYLWLLAASYYFYMCWNAEYALLMLFSTFITYLSGILLNKKKSRWFVAASFVINLGILFVFKYYGFAKEIAEILFTRIGIDLRIPQLDLLLPVGISFYTLQALGYSVDVYRGDIDAEKNFFRYALFVSFFPQLVAGPIERSGNLLTQLRQERSFDFDNLREGLLLMLWGFFMKIVIADRIALFVDEVYGSYLYYSGWHFVVAAALFAIQIYCDFNGYTLIAQGSAKILGIDIMDNFDAPYLSVSTADFWRRWHISLTSWFKDYLYIPLGGSKKGKLRKYINKMIVFLVSGLWHGADLSFVVWGGLNGLYQIIGEIIRPVRDAVNKLLHIHTEKVGTQLIEGIITFILVSASMIFFRADNITSALVIIKSIINADNIWVLFDGSIAEIAMTAPEFRFMILSIGVLLISDIMKRKGIKVSKVIMEQDYWCRWLVIALSVCVILVFGIWGSVYDAAAFIYFQF